MNQIIQFSWGQSQWVLNDEIKHNEIQRQTQEQTTQYTWLNIKCDRLAIGQWFPNEEHHRTPTIKTYILETVVYDLEAEKDKQLVAVVTSEVVDPNNMTKIAEEYVYKISKSFKKKK